MAVAPAFPAPGNGRREILKLQTNVPEVIALRFPTGMRVTSQFGDQIMYSLVDGRVIYLHPICEDKIAALDLGPKEPFRIVKAEIREGQRKHIEYQVSHVNAGNEAAPAPQAVQPAGKLREYGVQHFLGAHCTGVEAVYRIRRLNRMPRERCVVGSVGASFELEHGISPGMIAR